MKSLELSRCPDPVADAAYFRCLDPLEVDEGGYAHVPGDHGGETNYGITQAIYDKACAAEGYPSRSVKDIRDDEVTAIYYNWYWLAYHCDQIQSIGLAFVIFQACVNMSPKLVQQCRDLGHDQATFLAAQQSIYRQLAKQPDQAKFLHGWLARVEKTKAQAAALEVPVAAA